MRLTWKDGTAAAIVAVIVAIYAGYLQGAGLPLVSGVRGATIAIFILGAAGCALGTAPFSAEVHPVTRFFTVVAGVFGVTALVAGLIALVGASSGALLVLVGAIVLSWVTATLRHLLADEPLEAPPVPERDLHERIR